MLTKKDKRQDVMEINEVSSLADRLGYKMVWQQVIISKYVPCVNHVARCFACIISFHGQNLVLVSFLALVVQRSIQTQGRTIPYYLKAQTMRFIFWKNCNNFE